MKIYRDEIVDCQKKLEIKEGYIAKLKEEITKLKKQVSGLVENLQEAKNE